MIARLRHVWQRATTSSASNGLCFDRPLLLFQSDDWGRVGVRDREGWEQLRAAGIALGEKPYDCYSLETAEDLQELSALLRKHRDSVGRNPSIVMNFVLANVDFTRASEGSAKQVSLLPLTEGLPGQWRRPNLFEAYRQGIHDKVFFPALHGLTHFCANAVTRELQANEERGQFLRRIWRAGTPYIHWRMPWVGYEYWDPALKPESRFLSLEEQRAAIVRAAEIYKALFSSAPFSACAPGYRANADTRAAWYANGVRVVQNGPSQRKAPYLDEQGMLHTSRNVEMEPATAASDVEALVRGAGRCFRRGLPAVVSIHSINFHSSIRDFRTGTLALLDDLLHALKTRWPELLYVHDADLFQIVTKGFYDANDTKVSVSVTSTGARTSA